MRPWVLPILLLTSACSAAPEPELPTSQIIVVREACERYLPDRDPHAYWEEVKVAPPEEDTAWLDEELCVDVHPTMRAACARHFGTGRHHVEVEDPCDGVPEGVLVDCYQSLSDAPSSPAD